MKKCNEILAIRRSKDLKYKNVVLPEHIGGPEGYHMSCYRRFTALNKEYMKSDSVCTTVNYTTRSRTSPLPSTSTGIPPKNCIFCGKKDKKHNNKKQPLVSVETVDFEDKIKEYATLLEDQKMLAKLGDVDFVAKEIVYHAICRTKYQTKSRQMKKRTMVQTNKPTKWHRSRSVHEKAFSSICNIIEDEIIKQNEVYLMTDLNDQYVSMLSELSTDGDLLTSTTQTLETKVKKHFKEKIIIQKGKTRRGNLIFSRNISHEEALRKEHLLKTKLLKKMREVALALRAAIGDANYTPLSSTITLDNIMSGEIEIPEEVLIFFTILISGPGSRNSESATKVRRVRSISEDVVFAISSGRKKPPKHLKLGLALKSLTGSRKVIEMLNRYGHCASYTTIEEIETELAFSSISERKITPPEMKKKSNQCTGLAFDNFDRFVETSSGKDTLHDTVCIAYQRLSMKESTEESTQEINQTPTSSNQTSKRRRAFLSDGLDIEPYHKKPKITSRAMVPLNDERRKTTPLSYSSAKLKDNLWMVESCFFPNETPMWVGWNSFYSEDDHDTREKVYYLPQINLSPTSTAVVRETLKRAQQMATECNMATIPVTYDLAIAKMALEIQAEETPQFDNVFVALGAFHVEMSYFGVLGKFIADSGGPYVLNESHLIEQGSLPSFLSGKAYKRSKRLHQLLALAMEILHFNSFQLTLEEEDLVANEELKSSLSSKELQTLEEKNFPEKITAILKKYEEYRDATRNGTHGKTAKFWFGYVEMVQLYHQFIRSIRTGDLDLYIYCLPKLSNFFFAFNHHNYARWLVIYHDNLLKLKDTHPQVNKDFRDGCFALKRTSKPFSRIPIDLTLEQTINADAACQRIGITSLTNSISARQRWAQSHSIRVTIISQVFEEMGLTRKEDVTEELKPHRMNQNSKDLSTLINAVVETMNPFTQTIDKDHLFNIATGKAAQDDTAAFLLEVPLTGSKAKDEFIEGCAEDSSRFSQPIKRQKIKNFASQAGKFKVSSASEKKLVTVTMTRDLFGSILFHALQSKVDMEEVLKYPLTPVPLSLCHPDGIMQKTPKSKLLLELEKRIATRNPHNIDIRIIDGMFFLHLFVELPPTFGALAILILKQVCKQKGNEIHLIFDKTISPSIKDCERNKRGDNRTVAYQIIGPEQKRPGNWLQALRVDQFKEALVEFLTGFWGNDDLAPIIGQKKLYVNSADVCYSFHNENGIMMKAIEEDFRCSHEEADTRMLFHISKVPSPSNIVIRTVDTDVLVIALGALHNLEEGKKVWMETGIVTKNTLRYISVNQIHESFGKEFCKALPAFHAFTGCDYTASFNRKGKVRPLKLFENNESIQQVFSKLHDWNTINEEDIMSVESFVCKMYGQKRFASVNELRLELFLKKYKPKQSDDSLVNNMKK